MHKKLGRASIILLLAMALDAAVCCIRLAVFDDSLLPQTRNAAWAGALAVVWFALATAQSRRSRDWAAAVIMVSAVRFAFGILSAYLALSMKPNGFTIVLPAAVHTWVMSIAIPSALISVNLRIIRDAQQKA